MKKKRYFLAGLLLLWLVLSSVFSAAAETETVYEPSIRMQAECGSGGMVRGSCFIPMQVQVENTGEVGYSAEVSVKLQETNQQVYEYRFPVVIPAGETVIETCSVPVNAIADQIFVTLFGEEDRILAKQRLKPDFGRETSPLFVGVLSDTPEALKSLDNLSLNYGLIRTQLEVLDTARFPEKAEGIDMLDILLISNYRIRDLNEEQSRALISWVRNGGTMILGTGERVDDTLGRFAPELLEEMYEAPEMTSVNLGMEEDQPGDSYVETPCVDIALSGGTVLMSGETMNLLESVAYRRGTVAVCAFDFKDIAAYTENDPRFLAEILELTLGKTRLEEISLRKQEIYSDTFSAVEQMINSGNVKRLPDIGTYTLEILCYVFSSGIGIFLYLKRRDLTEYYRSGVILLSLLFTGLIFLMGNSTRFHGTLYSYARFLEYSSNVVSDTIFMNIRSPYNNAYEAALAGDYAVKPITEEPERRLYRSFTGEETPQIRIAIRDGFTGVGVQEVPAFEPKYFELKRTESDSGEQGFEGYVEIGSNGYTGEITSHFHRTIENCTLILYGRMILLGDIAPEETIDLAGREVLTYPAHQSGLLAAVMTGLQNYHVVDIDDDGYMKAVRNSNLLGFYVEKYLPAYAAEAKLIGVLDRDEQMQTMLSGKGTSQGQTIIAADIETYTAEDDAICRSGQIKQPTVKSGNYDAEHYTVADGESVILEYALGNDIRIEKVLLETISPVFLDLPDQNGEEQQLFEGDIYFYNHSTGIYDLMEPNVEVYEGEDLKQYLSPGNTVTLRFVPSGHAGFLRSMLLPRIYVVGRSY